MRFPTLAGTPWTGFRDIKVTMTATLTTNIAVNVPGFKKEYDNYYKQYNNSYQVTTIANI